MKSFKKFIAISLCLPTMLCSSCYAGQGWDRSVGGAGENYANKQYAEAALQFYMDAGISEDTLDYYEGRRAVCEILSRRYTSNATCLIDLYVEHFTANTLNDLRILVSTKLTDICDVYSSLLDYHKKRLIDSKSRYHRIAKSSNSVRTGINFMKAQSHAYRFLKDLFGKRTVTTKDLRNLITELQSLKSDNFNYSFCLTWRQKHSLPLLIEWFEDGWGYILPLIQSNISYLNEKVFRPAQGKSLTRTPQVPPVERVPLPPITDPISPIGFDAPSINMTTVDPSPVLSDPSNGDLPVFSVPSELPEEEEYDPSFLSPDDFFPFPDFY